MSTKGHHATRILIFLANAPLRPATKAEIARAENITPGYVQQLLSILIGAGLVKSYRGKSGGFALARPAEKITVQQVLDVTEGPLQLAPCLGLECPRASDCATHLLWMQAVANMNTLFGGTTVADLAASARSLSASRSAA